MAPVQSVSCRSSTGYSGDSHEKKKRPTEPELFENLDTYEAHADELAEPLEKLKGSVKKFERPTDPAIAPEDWECASEDVMKDREVKR